MSLRWLDPGTQTMPIVKIDTDALALYPYWGTHMLVVFPKGLSNKAYAQGFGHGFDNSSEGNSWESTFASVDEKGLLQVFTGRATNHECNYSLPLRWNGHAFMPAPDKKG